MARHMSLLCKLQQDRDHPPCHSGTCDGHGSGELCGMECQCECHCPPEYDPDDAEAQRIAEEFAEASAELARIEAEEIEPLHQWRPARDLDGEPIDRIEAEEARGLASCGHPRNEDGECDCSSWPERVRDV